MMHSNDLLGVTVSPNPNLLLHPPRTDATVFAELFVPPANGQQGAFGLD
jgi:hypothetical protein